MLQMDEQQDIANQTVKCKICDKDFESETDQILHINENIFQLVITLSNITIIHKYLLQNLFYAIYKIKKCVLICFHTFIFRIPTFIKNF